MLQTPEHKITVVALSVFLYLTAPFVEWWFYTTELVRGSFPANADSISIPLFQFMFGWVVFAPVAALIIWFCLRDYQGKRSLFGFNRERLVWSLIWSLIFAYPTFDEIFFIGESLYKLQPFDALQSLLNSYVLLCLRSAIVYRRTSV